MTSIAASFQRLLCALARMYGHADDDITRQLAFRSGWTEGVKDPLERKIIDLGDGRAVAEIVEAAL